MPPRLAAPLVLIALAAGLASGCGDSSVETDGSATGTVTEVAPDNAPLGASARSCETHAAGARGLRATGIACEQARQLLHGWRREPSCSLPSGASRGSCRTRSYRCQAVRADRGLAVSCSRPGRSIAFVNRG